MFYIILELAPKKSDVITSEGGAQTDLEIFCTKCIEPIEHTVETSQVEINSGSLRVKNEFKLKICSNGSEGNDVDENDDGMDDDDIDEDEERYAAIMAAAEDTDEDDEGTYILLNILQLNPR